MRTIVTTSRGIAVAATLATLLGACAGTGSQPTSSGAPVATPAPATSAAAPALTQTFTSTLHEISVSYPDGWTARSATEPWTDATFPLDFDGPQADFVYDPSLTNRLFLTMASQPIGDSTAEDWVATQMASDEGCSATAPITLGGATGLIGAGTCDVAVVATPDRGYWIQLYTGDGAPAYEPTWFEEIVQSAQLEP